MVFTSLQLLNRFTQQEALWKKSGTRRLPLFMRVASSFFRESAKKIPDSLLTSHVFPAVFGDDLRRALLVLVFFAEFCNRCDTFVEGVLPPNISALRLDRHLQSQNGIVTETPTKQHCDTTSTVSPLQSHSFFPVNADVSTKIRWLVTMLNRVQATPSIALFRDFLMECMVTSSPEAEKLFFEVMTEFVLDWLADQVLSDLHYYRKYSDSFKKKLAKSGVEDLRGVAEDSSSVLQEFLGRLSHKVRVNRASTRTPSKSKRYQKQQTHRDNDHVVKEFVAAQILLNGFDVQHSAMQQWFGTMMAESGASWASRELCYTLGVKSHPQSTITRINSQATTKTNNSTRLRDTGTFHALTFDNKGWMRKTTADYFHTVTLCWISLPVSLSDLPNVSPQIHLLPTSSDFDLFKSKREDQRLSFSAVNTTCNDWFSQQKNFGETLGQRPIISPVHVGALTPLDKVVLQSKPANMDKVEKTKRKDQQHSIVSKLPDDLWQTGDVRMYRLTSFTKLRYLPSQRPPLKKKFNHANVEIVPSWFKDLAQQETSQDIIEFATKSVPEGQPVVLCMNGKPANDIFRILIEKRAANVTIVKPILLVLGPMHVKFLVIEFIGCMMRGTCMLDDYLDMIGRHTEGKRNFVLTNGDSRLLVSDVVWALGGAFDACVEFEYALYNKSQGESEHAFPKICHESSQHAFFNE